MSRKCTKISQSNVTNCLVIGRVTAKIWRYLSGRFGSTVLYRGDNFWWEALISITAIIYFHQRLLFPLLIRLVLSTGTFNSLSFFVVCSFLRQILNFEKPRRACCLVPFGLLGFLNEAQGDLVSWSLAGSYGKPNLLMPLLTTGPRGGVAA